LTESINKLYHSMDRSGVTRLTIWRKGDSCLQTPICRGAADQWKKLPENTWRKM